MNKKNLIINIILVIMLVGGIYLFYRPESKVTNEANDKVVENTNTDGYSCSGDPEIYYQDDDVLIYLFCMDEVRIYDDENKIELKEYLEKEENNFSKILSKLKQEEEEVEEYEFYRDEDKVFYDDILVLEWNIDLYPEDEVIGDVYIICPGIIGVESFN